MTTNPTPRGAREDALSGHVDSGRTAGEHESQARGRLIDAARPLDLSLIYLAKQKVIIYLPSCGVLQPQILQVWGGEGEFSGGIHGYE